MKIALDITPISEKESSGHKVRGVGSYITSLKDNLLKIDKENSYSFFVRGEDFGKVDVVHFPYFEPFFLTLPFFKKTKTVVTVHDLTPIVFSKEFPVGIRGNIKWKIQKMLLKKVDSIITDSNSSKKDIVKILGVASEKVNVVYLAADNEFKKKNISTVEREEFLKKYKLPGKFGLYVGDATPNKNLPRLINSAKKSKIPMVLVGKALSEKVSYNPWNKDLIYVQNAIKNDELFTCLGFLPREDLVTIYNLAAFLILPSTYEGFGLPVLEAMSCGCPVVTTREGSLPEIAGDAALFIDAYDESSISRGIEKLFRSKDLREELVRKGEAQVKKFSWENAALETIEVYRQVNK